MKTNAPPFLPLLALVLAFFWPASPSHGRALSIGGNKTNDSFDPVSGTNFLELRTSLTGTFPGTAFTSLATLTGSLTGFDLIILTRFNAQDLQATEQTAIRNYVLTGGNLLFIGEAFGGLSNDTFTLPFGIAMSPDATTNIPLALASYTNPGHPFLNGPFGAPPGQPSGSTAAQVTTLGPSVEMARWSNGGGIAISAFDRKALAPAAGFGIFLTDVNMVTPNRYSNEVGPMISNALTLPEPSTVACLALGALACLGRRRSRVAACRQDISFPRNLY
ncbi:MAG: PEP-CTERM sorting domain-containing protein [Chthoniobacteraceae bacterium]